MKAICSMLLLVIVPACSSLRTGAATATTLTLVQADSVWAHNYVVHDTTAALRLMADDFFMTSGNGRTKDREVELRDIRPQAGLVMQYFRTEEVRAREYGSAGVVTGLASWAFEMNGRTDTTRRRYTAVYTRGGYFGWELVALHIGPAPQ